MTWPSSRDQEKQQEVTKDAIHRRGQFAGKIPENGRRTELIGFYTKIGIKNLFPGLLGTYKRFK